MSYQDIADMAEDWGLRMRLIACAAQEYPENPVVFVEDQIWRIAGQPGWGDAWAYARLTHEDVPDYEIGKDATVVTDGMILSSMQFVVNGVKERADQAAAAIATAAAEQAEAEQARQMAVFTAQRDVEIAKPILPPETPQVDPDPPAESMPVDPLAPAPADGPFQEPIRDTSPDVPTEEPTP